jgi:hypothetical protein
MLGFLVCSRPRYAPRANFSALRLERLDDRIAPATAYFSSLKGCIIGSNIIVYGRVADESPTTDVVHAGGAVSGTYTATATGKFEFISTYTGNNNATLYIHSDEGIDSPPIGISVQPSLNNANPYVSFHETVSAGRQVTFSGVVYDESPATCRISITGATTVPNITPAADGSFTVTVTASALGEVDCQAWDAQGAPSNLDFTVLESHKPVIDTLAYQSLGDNKFKLYGHVTGDGVQGLPVTFGGEVNAVRGQSALCDANGYFELTFTDTDPTDIGVITADFTDWWGESADTKTCMFNQ